jgi:uncharacterized NAD(P)/FAD-binding protein YdhS
VPPWAEALRGHEAFRQDPRDLPATLTEDQSVLIVGNGLTMADAASVLSRQPGRIPTLHTISRRGLIPKTQTRYHADATRGGGEALLASARSTRRLLRACRDMAREVQNSGGDWREAISFIRSLVPQLWRQLPLAERRRFVRHLQVHWDTYRHRLPPQLSERIENLRRSGKLLIHAGRIRDVAPVRDGLRVSWSPRGGGAAREMIVGMIVNATGPNYNIERSMDPLVKSLRSAGLISSDALNLGIRSARFGACVDAQGRVSGQVYYLGPLLRAEHLDVTAAAELSTHAERLAAHLAGR